MHIESFRIPKDRVAVLIGHNGETKRKIEELTGIKLNIDSETGEVEITSNKDALLFWKSAEVVKAISRGFNPEKALTLLDEDYVLEIIELEEIIGKSKNAINAKKGRIIGEKGKVRERIEQETNTFISVYGKTVGIIGRYEDVQKAKKAIEMLLEGAMHKTVFRYLEHCKNDFEI
ncbi:MAG: KH domain-containing protein [Candidatus Diapherotrites archaeon]|nr:KH domain-containing protein [Candidatus Diapherotrites archaeon]